MIHGWILEGNMVFGRIFWLAILGGIVWLFIIQSSRSRDRNHANPHPESPLVLLKKRYAKGEINKEQFEQMKKDLE